MTNKINTPADALPLTEAIIKIHDALDKLTASGLTKRALVVLLHDATSVNRRDISAILDALPRLKQWYTK